MNCEKCNDFIDGICLRAEQDKIHDLEDMSCLLKLQIVLLREILFEIGARNEKDGD
jgi:hypothetical protein